MNNELPETSLAEEVYEAIQNVVAGGRLESRLNPMRVFRDREYTAQDGWGKSSLDVALEAGQAGSPDGFILLAFTCRDEEEWVTPEEIQAFHEQLEKIGGPVKGIYVTPRALHHDAFKQAGQLNIGIVRLLPASQVLWLNMNMSPLSFREYDRIDASDFASALFTPAHMGQNRVFYGFSDGHLFGDWSSLLTYHLQAPARPHTAQP